MVAGAFHYGDIDRKKDPPVPTKQDSASLMNSLLDFIEDHALTQYVTEPTCPASMKTLDLVLLSVPSLVSDFTVKPGISDHGIVLYINIYLLMQTHTEATNHLTKYIFSIEWTCLTYENTCLK